MIDLWTELKLDRDEIARVRTEALEVVSKCDRLLALLGTFPEEKERVPRTNVIKGNEDTVPPREEKKKGRPAVWKFLLDAAIHHIQTRGEACSLDELWPIVARAGALDKANPAKRRQFGKNIAKDGRFISVKKGYYDVKGRDVT